jgi:hypothetical protein
MLGAAPVSVGFCCPECGAGLTAPRADAGTVLDCHRCGEHVRVPHQPHPVESSADAPLVHGQALRRAKTGSGLLLLSLAIFLIEFSVNAAAVGYWMATSGPSAYFTRDAGELRELLLAAWIVDLVLFLGRNAIRWIGYRLCEPAAGAVGAAGWMRAARHATLTRALAYPLVVLPWFLGEPLNETPMLVQGVWLVGTFAWLGGVGLEFAALFAWYRLLVELSGPAAARRVTVYAFSSGLALFTSALAAAVVWLTLWFQQGERHGGPGGSGRAFDPTAVTSGEWYLAGGLFLLISVLGSILMTQYARLLLTLRSGLAPAVR